MHRELYEAERWHSDKTYLAPMARIKDQNVFIGDVVTCHTNGFYIHSDTVFAKVRKFQKMVCNCLLL